MTREQIHIGDMSHETAIGILKLMLEAMETYDGISPTTERINAVKMAIESLAMPSVTPQLSSELDKNSKKLEKDFGESDCISRKTILDELKKWDWQELYLPIHFKQMLDELPTVTPQEPTIKALGEELRKARKGIADEKVLIGYNMAVAICNKHLGESEDQDGQTSN